MKRNFRHNELPYMNNPIWTLHTLSSSDNTKHDFLECKRSRRYFDISNLHRGTYDLFVGIRRDNLFFDSGKTQSSATTVMVDSDEEDGQQHLPDHPMVSSLKAGIGAAIKGTRSVVQTVTMGKVGLLAVELDVRLVDPIGAVVVQYKETLNMLEKSNTELRLVVSQSGSTLYLSCKSISTLHTLYFFSSLYLVEDDSEKTMVKQDVKEIAQLDDVADTVAGFSPAYTKPGMMLKRAFFGSRHPERSKFSRSLALACFASFSGFSLGFSFDTAFSLAVAGFVLCVWVFRATAFFLFSLIDS